MGTLPVAQELPPETFLFFPHIPEGQQGKLGGRDTLRPAPPTALSSPSSASPLQDAARETETQSRGQSGGARVLSSSPGAPSFSEALGSALSSLPASLSPLSFLLLGSIWVRGSQASDPNTGKTLHSLSGPVCPFLASAPENPPFLSFCDFPGFLLSCQPGCLLPTPSLF